MTLDNRQRESALEVANLFRNTVDRSSFVFAKAHQKKIKDDVESFLQNELDGVLEFKNISIPKDNPRIPQILVEEQQKTERKTIFFVHGLDEIAQAQENETDPDLPVFNILNFQRERLSENNVSFLMWVSESTLGKIMEKAPDFWRFRDLFVDMDSYEPMGMKAEGIFITEATPFGDQNVDEIEKSLKIKLQLLEELKRSNKDKTGTASKLHHDIGMIHFRRSRFDQALEHFNVCLDLDRHQGDRQGEGTTLNNIGEIYDVRGDYDEALKYLEQSLEIRREVGDRQGEGTTLNNIGKIYDAMGDYDEALKNYKQNLEISREIGDRGSEGATLNNIGHIYDVKGDYDEALKNYKQSFEIFRETGDRHDEGITLNNIGQIYDTKGDYGEALKYLEQSLEIRSEIGDRKGEGVTLNNISSIYLSKGDYDTALKYIEQSLEIFREIGDRAGQIPTLFNIARIYIQVKNDLSKGKELLIKAHQIANGIGDAMGMFQTSFLLAKVLLSSRKNEALKLLIHALEIGKKMGIPQAKELEQFIKDNFTDEEVQAFLKEQSKK